MGCPAAHLNASPPLPPVGRADRSAAAAASLAQRTEMRAANLMRGSPEGPVDKRPIVARAILQTVASPGVKCTFDPLSGCPAIRVNKTSGRDSADARQPAGGGLSPPLMRAANLMRAAHRPAHTRLSRAANCRLESMPSHFPARTCARPCREAVVRLTRAYKTSAAVARCACPDLRGWSPEPRRFELDLGVRGFWQKTPPIGGGHAKTRLDKRAASAPR